MPPFCAPFCDSEVFRALSRFAKGFGESVDIERVPTGRDKTPVAGVETGLRLIFQSLSSQ